MPRRNKALLDVDRISFSYGSVQVLFDVSLHVDRGETVALLGTNGAGKSTLLRVIAGLEPPSAGHVAFDGDDITGLSAPDRTRLGIALVPGGNGVFPDLTVDENLEVGSHLLRHRPDLSRERLARTFELFPALGELRRRLAGTLSGGEQQMLAVGKGMLLEPQLLCIDELSLGLAPNVVATLAGVVRSVAAAGTTVVLVEQSLNIAAALCERAVFMEKGEIRFSGPTQDLLDRDDIARAVFLGDRTGATKS